MNDCNEFVKSKVQSFVEVVEAVDVACYEWNTEYGIRNLEKPKPKPEESRG